MISLQELKKKASRLYIPYLDELLKDNASSLFPLVIPSNKGKASDDIFKRESEFRELHKYSKNNGKKSYTYETEEINTRSNGRQTVITKIYFETEDDFLVFIEKKESVKTLLSSVSIVKRYIYEDIENEKLFSWIIKHNDLLSDKKIDKDYWKNIAMCASWLYKNPNSNLYIRMIPLEVHSKFIENNISIIQNLLSDDRSTSVSRFIALNGLRNKPSFFRFRLLDENIKISDSFNPNDMYITTKDAILLTNSSFMKEIKNIFVVENEMIYLTFPEIKNSLVIWGHGFSAGEFSIFTWLEEYNLYYFGDIDEHGFEILSLFRKAFKHTSSICMDKETYKRYKNFSVTGEVLQGNYIPENLTDEEKEVFMELRNNPIQNRLEQERISQEWINERVKKL